VSGLEGRLHIGRVIVYNPENHNAGFGPCQL
jgi:hypothetical protein